MSAIRVYLLDDHTGIRQAIRVALEAERDLAVVGEAGDGATAVREIAAVLPDVAVIDLAIPGTPGLRVLPQIRQAAPQTALLVFTMHKNPVYVSEAIQAGATGYLLKSATMPELAAAIRAVHRGSGFLHSEVTGPVLRRLADDARLAGRASNLTPREIQILEALAEGHGNRQIAADLGISEETVKTHLKHLYEKLGASDRAQAVAVALRQKLID
jgi:DNA-binding NarL/FixJ family response regulator